MEKSCGAWQSGGSGLVWQRRARVMLHASRRITYRAITNPCRFQSERMRTAHGYQTDFGVRNAESAVPEISKDRRQDLARGHGTGSSAAAFTSPDRHQRLRRRQSVTASRIVPKNRWLSLRHASSYLLPDQTIPCTTCEKPLRSTCPNSRWTASQPPNLMTQAKEASFA